MTPLETSLLKSPEFQHQAKKAALSRWKLETLTGLLGIKSLQHHQREKEKNQAAENAHARKHVWGSQEPEADGEDMAGGHTILGDVMQQPPIIMQGPQGSGLGKMLAGAAIATAMIGIPGAGIAGYFLSQLLNKQQAQQVQPAPVSGDDFDMNFDLLQLEDLKNFGKGK